MTGLTFRRRGRGSRSENWWPQCLQVNARFLTASAHVGHFFRVRVFHDQMTSTHSDDNKMKSGSRIPVT